MSVELTALQVARSLTRRAAQVWLDGRRREQERTLDMAELVRIRIPGLRTQRSVERQFEQIADAVAARLEPLCAHEFAGLTSNDRQAVIDAVVAVLGDANLSDDAIIGADADAVEWARRVRSKVRPDPGLGEAGLQFFELMLAECCDCYIQILRRLPVFSERAIAELLERTSTLGIEVGRILERLPARSLYAPSGDDHDEEFRREYLGLVSQDLDEVELFSVLSGPAPRTALSVAYISLRVRENADTAPPGATRPGRVIRTGIGSWDEADELSGVRVEAALKRSPRTLLLGEAGSGKTTLLSWLAVTAARGGFTGDLTNWNSLIPFLIKLRTYAGRDLPALEAFLDGTVGPLVGHIPPAWVDRQFRAGNALLMVDGVDELVAGERRKVREWLRKLLHAYPDTHVVVTSRPTAASAKWLDAERFDAVSLERMTSTDLKAFVRQWHEAVRVQGGVLPCAPDDLPNYERALITSLQDRPHLQSLAASPLLAAMLCALHLGRRRQLPRNRMELYQTALDVLVQRRDAERGIPSAQLPGLSLTDKICVLRDLAWRLSDNNRNELSEEKARDYVIAQVVSMRHLDVDGQQVFDHLLNRSGVLRAPVEGRIDFVHRTFQEYLAAAEAAAEDRMGNLIGRAHLDPWRETIVMAAGHGNRSQRVELIDGILDRVESEPRHKRTLRLLAASCLETMESVPATVAPRLDDCIASLIPPRRISDADSLAQAGEQIIRWLPQSLEGLSDTSSEIMIRVAALIGGDKALELMSSYAVDIGRPLSDSIVEAWEYFEPYEYARHVLSKLRADTTFFQLTHPVQWSALTEIDEIHRLWIKYRFDAGLDTFSIFPDLRWLWVNCKKDIADFSSLVTHEALTNLVLLNGGMLPDTTPVAELVKLDNLQLQGWREMPPISSLSLPSNVSALGLGDIGKDASLEGLERHSRLNGLILEGSGCPVEVGVFEELVLLDQLTLNGFGLTKSFLANIAKHTRRLSGIIFIRCEIPSDLSLLSSIKTLTNLTIDDCSFRGKGIDFSSLAARDSGPMLTVRIERSSLAPRRVALGSHVKLTVVRE